MSINPSSTTFEEKVKPKRGIEPKSSAYQPSALPLGQTGAKPKFVEEKKKNRKREKKKEEGEEEEEEEEENNNNNNIKARNSF